jgi:hypothetical protein
MSGAVKSFNERDIDDMVAAYNGARNADAPLVLGHPAYPSETFGGVEKLANVKGTLFALASVSEPLINWVRQGRYKKVSASFLTPTALTNPVRGSYMLNHVGFLGATPPAVKGMAPLEFSGPIGTVFFGSATEPASIGYGAPVQAPAGYRIDAGREALYHSACQIHRALPQLSFADAASYAERIFFHS